jgi:chaperonin cofactor prefoldin
MTPPAGDFPVLDRLQLLYDLHITASAALNRGRPQEVVHVPDTFPAVDINKTLADVNNALKEGVYVAVGLGLIGFQRAQVQRVELTKQLEAQWEQLSTQLSALAKALPSDRGQLPELSQQLTEAGKAIEGQLADARTQLADARTQLADRARTWDERVQPARKQLEEQIDRLEQYLPAGARNVVQTVRAAAATPEQLLRSAVGLD